MSLHDVCPDIFEQPYVIPVILHALPPFMVIFRSRILLRYCHALPAPAKACFETRCDRAKTIRFQWPSANSFFHAAESGYRTLHNFIDMRNLLRVALALLKTVSNRAQRVVLQASV